MDVCFGKVFETARWSHGSVRFSSRFMSVRFLTIAISESCFRSCMSLVGEAVLHLVYLASSNCLVVSSCDSSLSSVWTVVPFFRLLGHGGDLFDIALRRITLPRNRHCLHLTASSICSPATSKTCVNFLSSLFL